MITGGRRRRWSDDKKARAVEASLEPGAVVSVVARQHGATPQRLFTWRREPHAYLVDVLTKIVSGHLNSAIDELLPRSYTAAEPLKAVV